MIIGWCIALYMKIRSWNHERLRKRRIQKCLQQVHEYNENSNESLNRFYHRFNNVSLYFSDKLNHFSNTSNKNILQQMEYIRSTNGKTTQQIINTQKNIELLNTDVKDCHKSIVNDINMNTSVIFKKYTDVLEININKSIKSDLDNYLCTYTNLFLQRFNQIDDILYDINKLDVCMKDENKKLDNIIYQLGLIDLLRTEKKINKKNSNESDIQNIEIICS